MKRHHIIPIVILAVVVAAFGAVYQFYVKQQLQEYAENRKYLENLETRVSNLQQTFEGIDGRPVKPEDAIRQWREQAQPFNDQIARQSRFFNYGDVFAFRQVPEGDIPKFYYIDERRRLEDELIQYAIQRGCDISLLDRSFAVPTSQSVNAADPPPEDVNKWLRQYNFGLNTTRMLVDAGATTIYGIVIWPPRQEKGLLAVRTVGLQFNMTLENLTRFLRDLLQKDRYYKVEALSVNNTNLMTPQAPLLKVDMLLSQANFDRGAAGAPGGGGGESAATGTVATNMNDPGAFLEQLKARGGLGGLRGSTGEEDEEPELHWYTGILRFFGF